MRRHHKKGQGLVEFAIVLPFFVVMLMAAFYLIMLCYNVITLSTLARDCARQLSVQSSSSLSATYTSIIENRQPKNGMLNYMYIWNPDTNSEAFKYTPTSSTSSIRVVLKATSNKDYSGAFFIDKFLPDAIYGESTMYWEKSSS